MGMKIFNRPAPSELNRRGGQSPLSPGEQQKRGLTRIDPNGALRVDAGGDIHVFVDRAKRVFNFTDEEARAMTDRLVLQNVPGKTVLHIDGREERR
jgi:hypothetical protein